MGGSAVLPARMPGLALPRDAARANTAARMFAIDEELRKPAAQKMRVAGLTLPDEHDPQSLFADVTNGTRVTASVGSEFLRPEIPIALRDGCPPAPTVLVPEAAVDEDRPSPSAVGEVGGTGKRPDVQAIGHPKVAQGARDAPLRLGPSLTHAGHEGASPGIRNQVTASRCPTHAPAVCSTILPIFQTLRQKPRSP